MSNFKGLRNETYEAAYTAYVAATLNDKYDINDCGYLYQIAVTAERGVPATVAKRIRDYVREQSDQKVYRIANAIAREFEVSPATEPEPSRVVDVPTVPFTPYLAEKIQELLDSSARVEFRLQRLEKKTRKDSYFGPG